MMAINQEKKDGQVIESIPEKLLKPIQEARNKNAQLSQRFFQASAQLEEAKRRTSDAYDKMMNNSQGINQRIKRAFDKMKLGKKKSYSWRFNGRDSFIGVPRPQPKPKPDEPKK
jgi:hypothetical protein